VVAVAVDVAVLPAVAAVVAVDVVAEVWTNVVDLVATVAVATLLAGNAVLAAAAVSGNVGRDSGTGGRDSGNVGRDSGNVGRDPGNVALGTRRVGQPLGAESHLHRREIFVRGRLVQSRHGYMKTTLIERKNLPSPASDAEGTKARVHNWADRQVDHWVDRWVDRWVDHWVDRWVDHWVDHHVDRWVDRWPRR